MDYDVRRVSVAARPTAVVARTTTWEEFPKLWMQLLDRVYEFLRGSEVQQSGHNVMLYLDDRPSVEVGVEVDRPFAAEGEVVASVLPAGDTATTIHRGPYDQLGAAHGAVKQWCAEQGYELAGPLWELYGDWRDDPTELETEIFHLLR
jgi:effector-binding domain-containing protein